MMPLDAFVFKVSLAKCHILLSVQVHCSLLPRWKFLLTSFNFGFRYAESSSGNDSFGSDSEVSERKETDREDQDSFRTGNDSASRRSILSDIHCILSYGLSGCFNSLLCSVLYAILFRKNYFISYMNFLHHINAIKKGFIMTKVAILKWLHIWSWKIAFRQLQLFLTRKKVRSLHYWRSHKSPKKILQAQRVHWFKPHCPLYLKKLQRR